MKNKTIYLVTLVGLLISGQQLSAMASIRAVAAAATKRVLRDYTPYAVVRKCVSYRELKKNIIPFIKANQSLQLMVDPYVKKQTEGLFAQHGKDVVFWDEKDSEHLSIGIVALKQVSTVIISMNDTAVKACTNELSESGYTRDDINEAMRHELGHALEKHTEKKIMLQGLLELTSLVAGACSYQEVSQIIQNFENMFEAQTIAQDMLTTHPVAVGAGIVVYRMGKKASVAIESIYSRYTEMQADGYILKTQDPEKIRTYLGLLNKFEAAENKPGYVKRKDIPWSQRTYPLHKDRKAPFEKWLKDYEAAENKTK